MNLSEMRRRWLFPVILLAAGVLGAGVVVIGCNGKTADPAQAKDSRVTVTVAPVTIRPIQRTVTVVGTLMGSEEVPIAPQVDGRVRRIFHDVGDVVRSGEILLELESKDFELTAEEARRGLEAELARLDLAELPEGSLNIEVVPSVRRAQASLSNAEGKLKRARDLRAQGKGNISVEAIEELQTEVSLAQAAKREVEALAKATLASARGRKASLSLAEERLRHTKVRVPTPAEKTNGPVEYVVAQRMASIGEMIGSLPPTPVFRLVADRTLKLRATVPERYISEVKRDQKVTLKVDAYEELFTGVILRINPTVDPVNRTFLIEVTVPNPDRRLKAGGFVKAAILTRVDENAVSVPVESIVTFAGVNKIFLVEDDHAKAVEVKLGVRGRDWVELLMTFPTHSRVVTSGQTQLVDGTPIRIRETPETMTQDPQP